MKIVFEEENKRAIALDNNLVIGFCNCEEIDDTWNIISTVVNDNYRGYGIAKKLVLKVMSEALKRNKKLISDCTYAKKILF